MAAFEAPRGLGAGLGPTLLVGLGNPGATYARTRHNVGWMALDFLAAGGVFSLPASGSLLLTRLARIEDVEVLLGKPQTYMNRSGDAVAEILRETRGGVADLLVIYDDVELPFGRIRIRQRGSHGGHNGIRSVLETLGTSEVTRVRIGIGREMGQPAPGENDGLRDYVLGEIDDADLQEMPRILGSVREALALVVTGQMGKAMSLFNRAPEPAPPEGAPPA